MNLLKSIKLILVFAMTMVFCNKVSAEEYTLSSATISITTAGDHSITGTGSGNIEIEKLEDDLSDAVYNITLNNMNLTANIWASAIVFKNKAASGSMTVNLIIVGDNSTSGYNHGGLKVDQGEVTVVFTTTSSGTLSCDAQEGSTYALQQTPGCTFNTAFPSSVTATATLAGNAMDLLEAIEGAFSSKPLVLTLTANTTATTKQQKEEKISAIYKHGGAFIEGLSLGDTYQIFNIGGRLVENGTVTNSTFVRLPHGIYILRSNNKSVKIAF